MRNWPPFSRTSHCLYSCRLLTGRQIYGPYVTITRGIDVSPKMVANFNSRAQAAGLSESTIHAVLGDLLDKANPTPAEVSGPEWQNFDLVTVGYAFHHFEDVVHAAERLKERLRPGGVMVITDFLEGGDLKADENGDPIPGTEGNHFTHHHHHHGHDHGEETQHHENHHHGHDNKEDVDSPTRDASIVTPHFTLENVKKFLIKAGFVDVDAVSMGERVYMVFGGHQLWRTVLFAKGRRPVEEKPEL